MRRLEGTEIAALRSGAMIPAATVGPIWGSKIPPEPTSLGETSGGHRSRSPPTWANDSNGYCWPSLGLGNTARAEVPEGEICGALESLKSKQLHDFLDNCKPSLGLGNTAGADILEGDVWGTLKSKQYVLGP